MPIDHNNYYDYDQRRCKSMSLSLTEKTGRALYACVKRGSRKKRCLWDEYVCKIEKRVHKSPTRRAFKDFLTGAASWKSGNVGIDLCA